MTTIHNQLARCPRMLVWAIALIIVLFACINTPAHAQEEKPTREVFTYSDQHITVYRVGDTTTPHHDAKYALAHEERYNFSVVPSDGGGLVDAGLDDVTFLLKAWSTDDKEKFLILTRPMTLQGEVSRLRVETDDFLGMAPGNFNRLRMEFYWPVGEDNHINELFHIDFELTYPNGKLEYTDERAAWHEYDRWRLDNFITHELDLYASDLFFLGEVSGIKTEFGPGEMKWPDIPPTKVRATATSQKRVTVRFIGDPDAEVHMVSVLNRMDRNDYCAFMLTKEEYAVKNQGSCEVIGEGKYNVQVITLPYKNAIYNGYRSNIKRIVMKHPKPWVKPLPDVRERHDDKKD